MAMPLYGYSDPGSGLLLWQMLGAAFVGGLFYVRRIFAWFKPSKRDRDPGNGD
jgi:hypothetical protein